MCPVDFALAALSATDFTLTIGYPFICGIVDIVPIAVQFDRCTKYRAIFAYSLYGGRLSASVVVLAAPVKSNALIDLSVANNNKTVNNDHISDDDDDATAVLMVAVAVLAWFAHIFMSLNHLLSVYMVLTVAVVFVGIFRCRDCSGRLVGSNIYIDTNVFFLNFVFYLSNKNGAILLHTQRTQAQTI